MNALLRRAGHNLPLILNRLRLFLAEKKDRSVGWATALAHAAQCIPATGKCYGRLKLGFSVPTK